MQIRTTNRGATGLSGITTLFDVVTDSGNVGTAETDIHSYTVPANKLANNNDKIVAEYVVSLTNLSTLAQQIRVYAYGTLVFDSAALAVSIASVVLRVRVLVQRISSSSLKVSADMISSGLGVGSTGMCAVQSATISPGSLNLGTQTGILKITGQSTGIGAASTQVVLKHAAGEYKLGV